MANQIWMHLTDATWKKNPAPILLTEIALWDSFETAVALETVGIGIMQLSK